MIVWDTQDLSIGRAPENDLVFEHGELSRRQALLARADKAFVVKNLSTSNSTRVNGSPIDSHVLQPGDVMQMADIRLEFHRGPRNPATLGARLEYSSQLKDFAPAVASSNPESTVLGLVDGLPEGPDDDFEVRPAEDFNYDLHGIGGEKAAPAARDLDAEIEALSPDDLELPAQDESWTLEDEAAETQGSAPGTLSLELEIEGLEGELRRRVEDLLGKTLELPALKIRLKGKDLG